MYRHYVFTCFNDTTILCCMKTILCHGELIFTSDILFICTQVSHLQFPVDNYLGIIHNNTYSIKLKCF